MSTNFITENTSCSEGRSRICNHDINSIAASRCSVPRNIILLQVPIVGVKPTLRRSKRLVRFGTLYGRVGDMGVKPIFPAYQTGTFNRNVNRLCNPTPFRSESLCFKGICTSQVYDGVMCRRSGNCPHLISRVQSE